MSIISHMQILNLSYIDSISSKDISTIDDIIRDERLVKHLWIELILNPAIVRKVKPSIGNVPIKDALTDALSWYLAFRWIFPENAPLEELHRKSVITPYRITTRVYRQKIRGFLKGLIHAGLC